MKWTAKWLVIYLVSNIITASAIWIVFLLFVTYEMTDPQLVNFGKRKAIEDYKWDYITRITTDPNSVSCEVSRVGNDEVAEVLCSVFDGANLVFKRNYFYAVSGFGAGDVAGFEDYPLSTVETK
ncbi:hypothetical protein [Neorhizobium sp. LjRoot104]|uniref:hypothetical protein n=1 Tax=Neorhizobium sp. LjRoot104 TaxID=3342254 RepID=UPI003ECF3999